MAVITLEEPIGRNGMKQKDLYTLMAALATNLSLVATTLNADTGVTAEDYAGITLASVTDINPSVSANGVSQRDIIVALNAWITAFNVILPKLDTDTLQKSDYESLYAITDVVYDDVPGDGNTYIGNIGMNQGTLINILNTCVTNLNALNAYLDADTMVNTATYAATCNITDSIYE